jgi:uncharacterized membrane protein YdjX (TVP38/TMEM64 family)
LNREKSMEGSTGTQPPIAGGRSVLFAMLLGIVFVAVIVAILIWSGAHHAVVDMLRWLDAMGPVALLVFIALMAVVVILLLPGVLFTTGAGFVFGVVQGSLAVVIGTAIGSIGAFMIARFLFGERATRWLREHDRLAPFNEELAVRGWRLVVLTRLMPLFPFKLTNYLFGLSPVSLRGFALGTVIGIIPWSVHNVYVGALAADLSGIGMRAERSPVEWALYVAGFIATIITIVYLSRVARRGLTMPSRER